QGFNPRQSIFFNGYALGDMRHQLKFHGYFLWRNLAIGPNIRFESGTPLREYFFARDGFAIGNSTNLMFRSPTGTRPESPNDLAHVAEYRIPDILFFNVRASYDFHELIGQHLIFSVDAFNLLKLATAGTVNTIDNAQFNTVASRQPPPMRFQFGLRYF